MVKGKEVLLYTYVHFRPVFSWGYQTVLSINVDYKKKIEIGGGKIMKQIKLTRVLSLSIILMFILTANGFAEQQPGQIYEYGTHFYQVVTTESYNFV